MIWKKVTERNRGMKNIFMTFSFNFLCCLAVPSHVTPRFRLSHFLSFIRKALVEFDMKMSLSVPWSAFTDRSKTRSGRDYDNEHKKNVIVEKCHTKLWKLNEETFSSLSGEKTHLKFLLLCFAESCKYSEEAVSHETLCKIYSQTHAHIHKYSG